MVLPLLGTKGLSCENTAGEGSVIAVYQMVCGDSPSICVVIEVINKSREALGALSCEATPFVYQRICEWAAFLISFNRLIGTKFWIIRQLLI